MTTRRKTKDGSRSGEGRRCERGFVSRVGVWLLGAIVTGIVPLAVSLGSVPCSRTTSRCSSRPRRPLPRAARPSSRVLFSLGLFLELFCLLEEWGRALAVPPTPQSRGRLQFLIIYVLVPLVPGLVVGYLTLSPATRLSQAIDWIRQPSGVQVERQVGQAIKDAATDETRVAGLRALAQFGSPDALNELARLARGNPRWLNDPPSFEALASALASFGGRSEPRLQTIWKESGPPARGACRRMERRRRTLC